MIYDLMPADYSLALVRMGMIRLIINGYRSVAKGTRFNKNEYLAMARMVVNKYREEKRRKI